MRWSRKRSASLAAHQWLLLISSTQDPKSKRLKVPQPLTTDAGGACLLTNFHSGWLPTNHWFTLKHLLIWGDDDWMQTFGSLTLRLASRKLFRSYHDTSSFLDIVKAFTFTAARASSASLCDVSVFKCAWHSQMISIPMGKMKCSEIAVMRRMV